MGWAAVDAPRQRGPDGLLGREDEIEAVVRALDASRLVTLTGPPGIGKTSLAVAVAGGLPEPTVVVELAAVADASLIPAVLASALSVQEAPGHTLMEMIVASLRRRRLLLVLDNCEHVRERCAAVTAQLLEGCPDLTVLATSREPLEAPDEQVCPVAPLQVPGEGEEPDPEAMLAYPAIVLFVERAAAVQRGFALTAPLARDVAEICRRLDGIPLAIELAAARMGAMTAQEIAHRLEAHLGLLSEHPRGALPRHQTLASALDWSYALLSDAERAVLCRLSVFAGTFELEAASAVCGDEIAAAPGILDLLGQLVSKSLLVRDADPTLPGRYRLLETVRTYAAEKLEQAGAAAEMRTLHAEFYTVLAERAEPEFTGPRQLDWFERMTSERANVRAALDWSLARGRADWALRLTGALVLFWRVRGPYSEGRDVLQAALSAGFDEPAALRAKALWGAGFMTLMTGDHEGATPALKESLALYRALADSQGCARALLILANAGHGYDPLAPAMLAECVRLARAAGDHWCLAHGLGVAGWDAYNREELTHARSMFEECLVVARDGGDLQGLRFGLIGLGGSTAVLGDLVAAEALLAEAVEVTRVLGEVYDRAEALTWLGGLAGQRGDYDRATTLLEEALSLLPELAPPRTRSNALFTLAQVAHMRRDYARAHTLLSDIPVDGKDSLPVLVELGLLAIDEGDLAGARRLLDEGLELSQTLGSVRAVAAALMGLGLLAREEGDLETAATLLADALPLLRQVGEMAGVVATLATAAGLAARDNDYERAARLFGATEAVRDRLGYAVPDSGRYKVELALARQSLSADVFDRACAEGRALELDQAVAEVVASGHAARSAARWANLSERELRVASLAAGGLSNPEIAARLVISRETVKTHLRRIYAKLGVAGRWGLARAVEAQDGRAMPPCMADQIHSRGG